MCEPTERGVSVVGTYFTEYARGVGVLCTCDTGLPALATQVGSCWGFANEFVYSNEVVETCDV